MPPKRGGAPALLQNVLGTYLRAKGLDREITRYRFVEHWPEIVGPDIAHRTQPECLRRGALVVRVTNSAWAQELSFQKQTILARLKQFAGPDEAVNDVLFYVGSQG